MTETTDLERVAIEALRDVASDRKAPAAARAAAARTLLETVGRIGRLQTTAPADQRPLHEMSAADLASEISRLRGERETVPGADEPEPDPFAE